MPYKISNIACVILASGNSRRFNSSKSKLFYKVYGTPVIEITLKNITNYINKDSIYITIPKKISKNERNLLSNYTNNNLISGGKTRFNSLKKALKKIDSKKYLNLLVHDAARPIVPRNIMLKLIASMNSKKYHCAVPTSVVEDTLRKGNKTITRENYKTYQTPQIFNFKFFINKINKVKNIPTDDFGIIENSKELKIKNIEASKENIKITKREDLKILKKLINYNIKFASGFDIHKLMKGSHLSLAGLKIKCNYQAIGHSDGDVVIHSLIDALLGANCKGDIGKHFPANQKFKNISSVILLDEIKKKINFMNSIVGNVDCTIVCQKIRLEKYKKEIEINIAKLLKCDRSIINVKAKTTDNVGTIGKSRAIACWTTLKLISL